MWNPTGPPQTQTTFLLLFHSVVHICFFYEPHYSTYYTINIINILVHIISDSVFFSDLFGFYTHKHNSHVPNSSHANPIIVFLIHQFAFTQYCNKPPCTLDEVIILQVQVLMKCGGVRTAIQVSGKQCNNTSAHSHNS